MAKYLRDERVSNISITQDTIIHLAEVFAARAQPLQQAAEAAEDEKKKPFLTFILRFDGKGYRVFNVDELLQYFDRAKDIERLIFTVETLESLGSNRILGEHLELRLDKNDENNNLLSVTSNDSDWVDASYSAVHEVLNTCKTRYGLARSEWATLAVQLLGVVGGFGISLWAASRISQELTVENAFVITFLFILLLFSNTWGYINKVILNYIETVFPNIQFYRPDKDKINWLMQAVIGGVAATVAAFLLAGVLSYIGDFLQELIK